MTANNSIIFSLDTKLELYSLDSVNYSTELVDQITSENRLELYKYFENFWQKNWALIQKTLLENSDNPKNIYFIISPDAGFTNTRIVFLWLKSLHQFWDQKVETKFIKITNFNNLKNLKPEQLQNLLAAATDDLNYSMEPRIGVK